MADRKQQKGTFLVSKHIRIHRQFVERLDALSPALETSEETAPTGKLTQQGRLRLALQFGIEALEARFGPTGDQT